MYTHEFGIFITIHLQKKQKDGTIGVVQHTLQDQATTTDLGKNSHAEQQNLPQDYDSDTTDQTDPDYVPNADETDTDHDDTEKNQTPVHEQQLPVYPEPAHDPESGEPRCQPNPDDNHEPSEPNYERGVEQVKRKRARTEHQKSEHNIAKYPLLPPCKDSCRKNCRDKFSDKQRALINKTYWKMTFGERRAWMDGHIIILDVKQRRVVAGKGKKRKHSLTYSLPLDKSVKSVCKPMFMHTLGMKTDAIITEYVRAKVKSATEGTTVSPTTDYRGRHTPSNKIDRDVIRKHINSYHPQVSHYTREHAPNRRYLDCYLTLTDMWKDFKEKHLKVSYELYRQVFEAEKITFGQPSQDACEVCLDYNRHVSENKDDMAHAEELCETCVTAKRHIERARKAREEYQKPVEDDVSTYAVDMQRVILLPKLSTKESFFVSRLVVFNETFANLTLGKPSYTVLWHEGVSGRLAGDVASSYIKCVILDSSPKILFWADNCTGQNKNWTLYTALALCVNSEWGPDEITIKYLQKGHTFMKADTIHGNIGNKMKKCENIYNFNDFVDLCSRSSKNIKPVLMHFDDFYEFKGEQRQRKSKNVNLPTISSISEVKFTKGTRSMLFKGDFGDDYTEVDFLRPKFDITSFPDKHTEPRGIPLTKKEAIIRLLHVAPAAKKQFWINIPEKDVRDLAEFQE